MSKLFSSILFLVFLSFKSCTGADTLSPGQSLTFQDTLSSEGAKLGINKLTGESTSLTAWTSTEDPSPGMFSLELVMENGSPHFSLMWNKSRSYWSSGAWDGNKFASVPEMRLNYIFNCSFVMNEEESYFTYSVDSRGILSRLVMDQSGQMKLHLKNDSDLTNVWDWSFSWNQPRSLDDVYAACGAFGVLNQNDDTCQCLQGFKQSSDQVNGCLRNTTLKCQDNIIHAKEENDGFLKIGGVDLPDNPIVYAGMKRKMCEAACLQYCSCNAYAYNARGCLVWRGDLINVKYPNGIEDLYLKLAASELKNIQGLESSGEDLLLFDFDGSTTTATDYDTNSGRKKHTNDFELPFFSFASVSAATRGFSSETKLGEGGFGPVYMGTLLRGQEIAVKRLSKRSGQGVEEFRNEIVLIAKLQHRNLVRLLGCCVEQDENILIYEYMPNKSLDYFLFGDLSKKQVLNWSIRIDIIEGIAQGLLYLHRYSRLRIIHRDLKASNILLDSTMNPKISDFGMARIFGANVTQANTNRIVGTYGYMAPEYAVEGHFSVKSDVFSFGVLLLEIISGKRNTGFYHSDSLNLLTHAWDLWNVDKGLELLDPTIDNSSSGLKSLRYINIGLLCIQEHPDDRPTMSDIVSMLSNELVLLPTPMKPAFSTWRTAINKNASSNSLQICSVNGLTTSGIKAR